MKTVIITGGSGGIGSAIAERFANDGWYTVIIYNRNKAGAEELLDNMIQGNRCGCICRADVTDPSQVSGAVEYSVSQTGRIDALVNCAGVSVIKPLSDMTDGEIYSVINTDLTGTVFFSRDVSQYMVRQGSGAIVNISSMWGVTGASCETVYSAAKAGIIGFTRALALELAPSGIRVNCVSPGYTETPMNSDIGKNVRDELIGSTPLGRAGVPRDIAEAVYFLADDRSSFITGQNLTVDGGFTL